MSENDYNINRKLTSQWMQNLTDAKYELLKEEFKHAYSYEFFSPLVSSSSVWLYRKDKWYKDELENYINNSITLEKL